MNKEKILADLQKDFGNRIYLASEAPPVKVLSTGITSLDVATGIGGWPIGTIVEVFGRPSTGKSALAAYSVSALHQSDPNAFAAWVNVERAPVDKKWLARMSGLDLDRLLILDAEPGSDSVKAFGRFLELAAFGLIVFDSIGAMSTDKELKIGESKQAFGQSAMVTQMIKQASKYLYDQQAVALILNQVRADADNPYVDKAPGGYAKDHGTTIRVLLKSSNKDTVKKKVNGEDIQVMFRVNAQIVKNRVSAPRRRAGWNFWNYESPTGVIGIDKFQDAVDTALNMEIFERAGAWYRHDKFPDGKLNGGAAVSEFLRSNPDAMEEIRREMVLKQFNEGEQDEA
jgi:recombination protein RecA